MVLVDDRANGHRRLWVLWVSRPQAHCVATSHSRCRPSIHPTTTQVRRQNQCETKWLAAGGFDRLAAVTWSDRGVSEGQKRHQPTATTTTSAHGAKSQPQRHWMTTSLMWPEEPVNPRQLLSTLLLRCLFFPFLVILSASPPAPATRSQQPTSPQRTLDIHTTPTGATTRSDISGVASRGIQPATKATPKNSRDENGAASPEHGRLRRLRPRHDRRHAHSKARV